MPTGASEDSLHSPRPGAPLPRRCLVTLGWGGGKGATSRHSKAQGTAARELGIKLVSAQTYSVAVSKFPSLPVSGATVTPVSLGPW